MKQQTHDEFLKEHFNTGLKLSDGWKIEKFPPLPNERFGSPMNSKSQIVVVKGNSKISMVQWDGRLGGGFRITVDRNTPKSYDSFNFHVKNYDEALQNLHSLMRMIK